MKYTKILDSELKKELTVVYTKYPVVRKYLKEFGCDSATCEDLFQEACLIYARRRQESSFVLTAEPILFVRNTAKLLWFNQARKEQKIIQSELSGQEFSQEESDFIEKEEKLLIVEQALSK